MARLFDDVATEYLEISSAVLTAVPLSMACWFYGDDIAAEQGLMTVADASADNFFLLKASGAIGGDPIRAETRAVGASSSAASTAGFTLNTWHHACGVWADTDDRAAFIDGGNKGTEFTARVPLTIDTTTIGARTRNAGHGNYTSGRIAEAAIWNVALTDAEVAILALGYSPLFVQPELLVAYWPLIRDEDQDRVGGYDMTAFNAPSIASHASVIYPAMPFVMLGSGVCVTTVTVTETTTVTVVAQV